MTMIRLSYGAMSAGHEGLVATWRRIESHLADLEAVVATTAEMSSEALHAYSSLKARWAVAAADRQHALRALADAVDRAAQSYRQVDAAAAAQFTM